MARTIKIIAVIVSLFFLFFIAFSQLGGAFRHLPEEISKISPQAKALIEQAYEGIDAEKIRDYHTHIVGLNELEQGTFVNHDWQSFFRSPLHNFTFQVYKSGSSIKNESKADEEYVARLIALNKNNPRAGKSGIMAFDFAHSHAGFPDRENSTFRVPNERVVALAEQYPDYFFPVISIHPARKDALRDLAYFAGLGVRYLKWLPNSMNINPGDRTDSRLKDFYLAMVKHNMVLITHTGDEKATDADEHQKFGNPMLLKYPLELGVNVVMAHVATLGDCRDDEPKPCESGRSYFDIALRMLKENINEHSINGTKSGLLLADISATTQYNRIHHLPRLLRQKSIASRLINGTDYPLPAINIVIRTRDLVEEGLLTETQRELLNEIYDYNPIMFDFVLKRTVSFRTSGSGEENEIFTFPASVFMQNSLLPAI